MGISALHSPESFREHFVRNDSGKVYFKIIMKNKLTYILSLLLFVAACSSDNSPRESGTTLPEQPTQNRFKFTAEDMRTAALQGNLDVVQQCVTQGIDIEEADQLDRTALMFASFNGHTEIVGFLIEKGADVQKQNSEGRSSLMFASSGPFPETVQLLLENGSDPNAKDSIEGWTPLMYAAAEGNIEVIEVLLDYDADVTLQDTDGETATDFARNNGHSEVVALLESQ